MPEPTADQLDGLPPLPPTRRRLPTDELPSGRPTVSPAVELLALREPVRLLLRAPGLATAPRGRRNVVTIPGWKTDGRVMLPIGTYLRTRGHDVVDWGLGTNTGAVEPQVDAFVERLASRVAEVGRPAALVGWSLGGVVAREAARRRPDLVERVVHFGTPAVDGPLHTVGSGSYPVAEQRRIAAELRQLNLDDPITVPVTVFYSRRDPIVDWRAQLDGYSLHVQHREVSSTHLGMGLDPEVWLATARLLAD